MIGVAGQDGKSAVNLLRQYDPRQLMGQSHASQGEKKVGALSRRSRPSVRRTNGEHNPLCPLVAKPPNLTGELLGAVLPPATVKQNRISTGSALLTFDPLKQRFFRFKHLRLARCVSSDAADVVIEPPPPRLG